MLVASIWVPHWVTYSVTTTRGDTIEKHIGLHKSCSTLDDPYCRDFPSPDMCQHGERYFCSMWRTIGFMASFATILCLACIVSFGVIMGGGKYKRETGWPFVGAMLTLVSAVEFVIISMVVSCERWEGDGEVNLARAWRPLTQPNRRTSTTTTTSSPYPAGTSTFRGTSAPSAPQSRCWLPAALRYPLTCSPQRTTTTSWRIPLTRSPGEAVAWPGVQCAARAPSIIFS